MAIDIAIDESRVPIILVTYPEVVTLDQIRLLFDRYALLSRRHARIAYLCDFTRFNPVFAPGDVRKTTGDLFVEHREVLARVTVCEARVVPSMLTRAAITAFDSVARDKWPCACFATMTEAEAWIAGQLGKRDTKGAR